MDIDRRAFLASVGGLAVVEALDDEAKAEALEHYMMDMLDGHEADGLIIGGEAQVAAAPADASIRRGAGNLFGPQGPAENRKMPPELAAKMQYDIDRWQRGASDCNRKMPPVAAAPKAYLPAKQAQQQ